MFCSLRFFQPSFRPMQMFVWAPLWQLWDWMSSTCFRQTDVRRTGQGHRKQTAQTSLWVRSWSLTAPSCQLHSRSVQFVYILSQQKWSQASAQKHPHRVRDWSGFSAFSQAYKLYTRGSGTSVRFKKKNIKLFHVSCKADMSSHTDTLQDNTHLTELLFSSTQTQQLCQWKLNLSEELMSSDLFLTSTV